MSKITEVVYFGFELELLEAHIAEHRQHVDRLIVAEQQLTSTGYPKPLFARDNRSRFEKYDVELVEVPTDGYQKIVPETNRPGFPFEGRLIHQEKIKKRFMHPIVRSGVDYVLHSDTDEIITEWDKVKATLDEGKGINDHVGIGLTETSGYVNVKSGHRDVYRFARAVEGFDPSHALKSLPRGFVAGHCGWHFSMCCSRLEEYYWKWLNRTDDWGSYGDTPPTLLAALPKLSWYLSNMGPTTDPMLIFAGKHFAVPTPENVVELSDLPSFIGENINLFPHIEVQNEV